MCVDYFKAFDSIKRKGGANTTSIWSPQRNCYRNNDDLQKHEKMIRTSDGDTGFFNIVAGFLRRDTLVAFLFITCLDYVSRRSIYLMKK